MKSTGPCSSRSIRILLHTARCALRSGLPGIIGLIAACSAGGEGGGTSGSGSADSGPLNGTGGWGAAGGGGAGSVSTGTCGNGHVDTGEQCDTPDLNGATCATATLNAKPMGQLACTTDCQLDVSTCTTSAPGSGGGPGAGGTFGAGGSVMTGGGTTSQGGSTSVVVGGPTEGGCGQSLPALPSVTDYEQDGPFGATVVQNTGPDGNYTMYRPGTLGPSGFLHPPTTWGNGITTTPAAYDILLKTIASHGFVIIASNSTSVTAALMTSGLDWLVAQNDAPGELQGKLDTKCLVTIGYSLGGGAAVTAGSHADVITTVSMHGVQGSSDALHAPLLLLTSETDTFVTAAQFVTPTYNASVVQTFYGTLSSAGDPNNYGHLIPINSAGPERGPVVAWLRLWAYGDPGAKQFFYGNDCVLCTSPWTNPQRKNWP